MTQEFISYEQALKLKELGFNEACFGHYDNNRGYSISVGGFESYEEAEVACLDRFIHIITDIDLPIELLTEAELDYELGVHDCGQNPYCSSFRSCGNDIKPYPSAEKIKLIIEIGIMRLLKEGYNSRFIKEYFKEKYK
jgi:hypothetical protein